MNARNRSKHSGTKLTISFVIGAALMGLFLCREQGASRTSHDANAVAFIEIGGAHSGSFAASATQTEAKLAQMAQLLKGTEGSPALDPRIREFALAQIAYEQAFAVHASDEESAARKLKDIPVSLWEMQKRYHEQALELARIYAPQWVSGLSERIAEDEEILRRARAGD